MTKESKYNSEVEFLDNYDPTIFDRPSTSVDTVIFTVFAQQLQVLLVKRANYPFKNQWTLVGGFIDLDNDHTLEDTARRKLEEKTGVKTPYLEQCFTIGNKQRDPRGWSVTTVYFALLPYHNITLTAGKGAIDIKWSPIIKDQVLESLAFDHSEILRLAIERLRNKVLYTSLPAYLMSEKFTLGDLQKVYEVILDRILETKSFRRRIAKADILEETTEMRQDAKRPAKLYRLKDNIDTYFFLRNIEGAILEK
ncbi:NrtR DNA-binding winged helix domain-containing protein [Geminocystis sp. NIES-3709]|uniref:NUDIX hydrolase n=1 Tax=Geminocystis sp. NIES-3709 TaxID=1617448 RepID=UPI0005FCC197|nr:NUDIX domain-containing protein [Geminocystis sp. NIES-3709]BAQ64898.1 nudix-related transcriptional regulator NrtR [Geminocystis sp. NIES-3709]